MVGRGCQRTRLPASSAPCPTPSGGADRRSGPGLLGASRGQPVAGPYLAPLPLRGRAPESWGLGTGGVQTLARSWQGHPGVGTGDGRQVGPSLGLGEVQGGGEGPGQVRAGARRKLSRNVCWAVGRNSALGTRCLASAPAGESGGFRQNSGEAGRAGWKGEGPGRPLWMGTRDERIRQGHDVWRLPCQCLMSAAYGYFRTKGQKSYLGERELLEWSEVLPCLCRKWVNLSHTRPPTPLNLHPVDFKNAKYKL